MARTKDEILKAYKDLREKLQKQPSFEELIKQSKINLNDLKKAFGSNSFSKLVEECGDTPKQFFTEKADLGEILEKFGQLAREIKKAPNSSDWVFYKLTPTPESIKRFQNLKWADLTREFYLYAKDNPKWSDVIDLFSNSEEPANAPKIKAVGPAAVNDIYQDEYIPPIVENLVSLSFNEEKAIEFENKVNVAFEILGFEVKKYGQGTGRNPDGIALDRENHCAILIDAKARSNHYKIGTEDRKFIEYIEKYVPLLKKEGFKRFYFLVVSSKYETSSEKSLENIVLKTQVRLSLMTSKQLLKILSSKIKSPRTFDLQKFEKLLLNGNVILDHQI